MANTKFSRDEAILALDVLYSTNEQLKPESEAIIELSELLNSLPIHKNKERRSTFRNPSGVCKQIRSFARSIKINKKDPNVGIMFYEVANEFNNRFEELHLIANAIRKNKNLYDEFQFGCTFENSAFPEGALLEHLHYIIEVRDGLKIKPSNRCSICRIKLDEIYRGEQFLLTPHLATPLTELDGKKKYKESDFLTVCPNCHAALHHYRPWLSKDTAKDILK